LTLFTLVAVVMTTNATFAQGWDVVRLKKETQSLGLMKSSATVNMSGSISVAHCTEL
jgi:hypothetical protein